MPGSDRRALGRRCRDHAIERFSLTTMHANLDRVYGELVPNLVPTGSGA
jgi:hypothetical protein